jgi:hypothetical protein
MALVLTGTSGASTLDSTNGLQFATWTTATRPASPVNGQVGYNSTTGALDQYVNGAWQSVSIGSGATPTITRYTSGSGTYTTPTGAKYLTVEMVGGGGGGGGSDSTGAGATVGSAGGTTTFGTSLLTCTGGGGGNPGNLGTGGGFGGGGTVNSPATGYALQGNQGGSYPGGSYNTGTIYTAGGYGGISTLGTAFSGSNNSIGGAGGGGGYSGGTSIVVGTGGAAGGYLQAIIASPSATYSYAVGAGGAGGAAGSGGGGPGYIGGAGVIIVTAYF